MMDKDNQISVGLGVNISESVKQIESDIKKVSNAVKKSPDGKIKLDVNADISDNSLEGIHKAVKAAVEGKDFKVNASVDVDPKFDTAKIAKITKDISKSLDKAIGDISGTGRSSFKLITANLEMLTNSLNEFSKHGIKLPDNIINKFNTSLLSEMSEIDIKEKIGDIFDVKGVEIDKSKLLNVATSFQKAIKTAIEGVDVEDVSRTIEVKNDVSVNVKANTESVVPEVQRVVKEVQELLDKPENQVSVQVGVEEIPGLPDSNNATVDFTPKSDSIENQSDGIKQVGEEATKSTAQVKELDEAIATLGKGNVSEIASNSHSMQTDEIEKLIKAYKEASIASGELEKRTEGLLLTKSEFNKLLKESQNIALLDDGVYDYDERYEGYAKNSLNRKKKLFKEDFLETVGGDIQVFDNKQQLQEYMKQQEQTIKQYINMLESATPQVRQHLSELYSELNKKAEISDSDRFFIGISGAEIDETKKQSMILASIIDDLNKKLGELHIAKTSAPNESSVENQSASIKSVGEESQKTTIEVQQLLESLKQYSQLNLDLLNFTPNFDKQIFDDFKYTAKELLKSVKDWESAEKELDAIISKIGTVKHDLTAQDVNISGTTRDSSSVYGHISRQHGEEIADKWQKAYSKVKQYEEAVEDVHLDIIKKDGSWVDISDDILEGRIRNATELTKALRNVVYAYQQVDGSSTDTQVGDLYKIAEPLGADDFLGVNAGEYQEVYKQIVEEHYTGIKKLDEQAIKDREELIKKYESLVADPNKLIEVVGNHDLRSLGFDPDKFELPTIPVKVEPTLSPNKSSLDVSEATEKQKQLTNAIAETEKQITSYTEKLKTAQSLLDEISQSNIDDTEPTIEFLNAQEKVNSHIESIKNLKKTLSKQQSELKELGDFPSVKIPTPELPSQKDVTKIKAAFEEYISALDEVQSAKVKTALSSQAQFKFKGDEDKLFADMDSGKLLSNFQKPLHDFIQQWRETKKEVTDVTDVKNATDDLVENIKTQIDQSKLIETPKTKPDSTVLTDKFTAVNQALEKHNKLMGKAVSAEIKKAEVSETLTKQLGDEAEAFERLSTAIDKVNESKVDSSGKPMTEEQKYKIDTEAKLKQEKQIRDESRKAIEAETKAVNDNVKAKSESVQSTSAISKDDFPDAEVEIQIGINEGEKAQILSLFEEIKEKSKETGTELKSIEISPVIKKGEVEGYTTTVKSGVDEITTSVIKLGAEFQPLENEWKKFSEKIKSENVTEKVDEVAKKATKQTSKTDVMNTMDELFAVDKKLSVFTYR